MIAEYLDAARESGLLHGEPGRQFVADAYTEPLTGRRQVLVEHADVAVVRDERRLVDTLRRMHPDATGVVLRVEPAMELPAPWQKQITYVGLDRADEVDADLPITVAEPEHDRLVRDWLVTAFRTAGGEIDHAVDPLVAAEAADDVLAQPGRVSFLVWHNGDPVGHATLLCDARDEVTGVDFVELLDSLVEPVIDVRRATSALSAVAARHAGGLGLPLHGNVVHPADDALTGKGERILAALSRHGWRPLHRFWFAPLGDVS